MIACMNAPTMFDHLEARTTLEHAVLGGLLRDNAAIDRVEQAEADFYSADHWSAPGLPGEFCEGNVVSTFKSVSMIDQQANLMQKAFATGRMDDARAHCKIFTELARERAASFLNDGTGAPGQADSCPAGTPSPHHDRSAQGDARQEK